MSRIARTNTVTEYTSRTHQHSGITQQLPPQTTHVSMLAHSVANPFLVGWALYHRGDAEYSWVPNPIIIQQHYVTDKAFITHTSSSGH